MTRQAAGFVRGHYYAEYVDVVRSLRREGRETEAQTLLLELVEATEAESRARNWVVAPWYYEQLAISYRKSGDIDGEVAILERYTRQIHDLSHPLRARLEKARARAERSD
jgi:hypothetical protein